MSSQLTQAALAARINRAMNAKGWSGKQLAEQLGADSGQVSRWLAGERSPSAKWLMKIPGTLEVSGHWLLTNEGAMEAPGRETTEPYRLARESVEAEVAIRVREAVVRALGTEVGASGKRDAAELRPAVDRRERPRSSRRGAPGKR